MDILKTKDRICEDITCDIEAQSSLHKGNLDWMRHNLHPYVFLTMHEEPGVMLTLATNLHRMADNQRITLVEREDHLICACLDQPGTLYESMQLLGDRAISYAEITHSMGRIPGVNMGLELQRFHFARKSEKEVLQAPKARIPLAITKPIVEIHKHDNPDADLAPFKRALELFWINNENYVRVSPPQRVARVLWLYLQAKANRGLYLHTEPAEDVYHHRETRVMFSVGNPPSSGFMAQVVEVLNRLGLGIRRAYCLSISTGVHPYLMCTFYVTTRGKGSEEELMPGGELFAKLRRELYNTQVLAPVSRVYRELVVKGTLDGEQGTLVNAMTAFCHTTLGHNSPDRYDLTEVRRALDTNPRMCKRLAELFQLKFDPGLELELDARTKDYATARDELESRIAGYNTGHRWLDQVRKTVFRAALALIDNTLKTNFYVPEKHGISFRLDPAYLETLGEEFSSDLPPERPFRITFFFGRYGAGYHIGFSDIARGGWRTILCSTADDFITNSTTLFREVYVLAHTQHLKNKDIYEGGSKLAMVLDTNGLERDRVTARLYKEQYGLINAFLDIYVTDEEGCASSPHVIDYYREDEPIELGPDENMHDEMVELIACLGRDRGYVLGNGIISSKNIGINHKQYGVTSLGVVTFAEIIMRDMGIDIRKDVFTVKITGGTNGDVAGNAMRLLLDRCPKMELKLVASGSGALFDPDGIDHTELSGLVLRENVDSFDPEKLNIGGFILHRNKKREEGLRELFLKVVKTPKGVEEQWVTSDEFYREFASLLFTVDADLFIPAGGRPETVHEGNWDRFLDGEGKPTCRVVVEGANSYITPPARQALQDHGVVIIRDASANKCGVISSSYEIIANLMMTDKEFLRHKDAYVADVLKILEKRASDEAHLLLARKAQGSDKPLVFTEISRMLSDEINAKYAMLFEFFTKNPELADTKEFKRVIMSHLPDFLGRNPKFRKRVSTLPRKVLSAILASEIATSLIYRGGWGEDFEVTLARYVKEKF